MQIQGRTVPHVAPPRMAEGREFTQLILKLRWIGLEDEANRLQRAVQTVAPERRATVLSEPRSTD